MSGQKVASIGFENGFEIELVEREGVFEGLGAISFEGFPLRDGTRPLFVEIRNPSAINLTGFRVVSVQQDGKAVVITLGPRVRQSGMMEWMLHTVRNRMAATDWTDDFIPAEDTVVELVLEPVDRRFGPDVFTGFSYSYRYRSAAVPIYKILDRGTWEPGGRIVGSEFWLRNGFHPSIQPFTGLEQRYSTEWYAPSLEQPNIFQFFPFQVEFQGFTFTAAPEGNLVTWATDVSHIRSLFEKHAGKDALFHWHEHCGDLGLEFSTSPIEVLWQSKSSQSRVDRFNTYERVRDFVWRRLHEQIGLQYEKVEPYGVIEEWTIPDMDAYREKALPALLDLGVKTIYIPNQFENNMNVWGVGTQCCNVDFKVAERVGELSLRAFCDAARNGGAKVEMWGNTAMSSLTAILDSKNGTTDRIRFLPQEGSIGEALREAANPYVRNASGAIEADHYTPVFCALNLRDPSVRDYWLKSWRHLHRNVGVDQIFVDSSFNMSADKFTHRQNDEVDSDDHGCVRPGIEPRQAIESQYRAYLELLVEMQRMGYTICVEDTGVFGLSRSGPDIEMRIESMPMWLDSYCSFDPRAARRLGQQPDDVFFRGLAYRMMWQVYFDIPTQELTFHQYGARDDDDRPNAWHGKVFRAYSEALPVMRRRSILPEEAGVEYEAEGRRVIWAFATLDLELEGTRRMRHILAGSIVDTDRLTCPKNEIVLIEPPATA